MLDTQKPLAITLNGKKYLLFEEIGRGGFAHVYRAETTDQESVALKWIGKGHPDYDAFRDLETRGAEISRRALRSGVEGIAEILDYGECEEGFAIIMDYFVEGSLADLIDTNGALAPHLAEEIILDVAETISKLHAQQIIHRDISPRNILARDGKYYLADFGTLRYIQTRYEQTRVGAIGFSAPECFTAPEEAVDERADVYSFGALLFFLLSDIKPEFREEHLYRLRLPYRKMVMDACRFYPQQRTPTIDRFVAPLNRRGIARWLSTVGLPQSRAIRAGIAALVLVALVVVVSPFLTGDQASSDPAQPPSAIPESNVESKILLEVERRLSANPVSALAMLNHGVETLGMTEELEKAASRLLRRALPDQSLQGFPGDISESDLSADGKWAVAANEAGTLVVWDMESGASHALPLKGMPIYGAKFSPDSGFLAIGSASTIFVWDTQTWELRHTLRPPEGDKEIGLYVAGLGERLYFSEDSRYLFPVCGVERPICCFDLEDGRLLGYTAKNGVQRKPVILMNPLRVVYRSLPLDTSASAEIRLWKPNSLGEPRDERALVSGLNHATDGVTGTKDGRYIVFQPDLNSISVFDLINEEEVVNRPIENISGVRSAIAIGEHEVSLTASDGQLWHFDGERESLTPVKELEKGDQLFEAFPSGLLLIGSGESPLKAVYKDGSISTLLSGVSPKYLAVIGDRILARNRNTLELYTLKHILLSQGTDFQSRRSSISDDQKVIAIPNSSTGKIRVFELSSFRLLREFSRDSNDDASPYWGRIHPSGESIFIFAEGGRVDQFDISSGGSINQFEGNGRSAKIMFFVDNDSKVVIQDTEFDFGVWELSSGALLMRAEHSNHFRNLVAAPDSSKIFLSSTTLKWCEIDLGTKKLVETSEVSATAEGIALSPDGGQIARSNREGEIEILSLSTMQVERVLKLSEGYAKTLEYFGSQHLFFTTARQSAGVLDLESGEVVDLQDFRAAPDYRLVHDKVNQICLGIGAGAKLDIVYLDLAARLKELKARDLLPSEYQEIYGDGEASDAYRKAWQERYRPKPWS